MKKRILLIDESLTVQKVVSLTLDKNKYQVNYAKTRNEAVSQITENTPDLILVSDQVSDLTIPSFPKELETWLGRTHEIPPIILITAQDIKEIRHYAGVLRKPFSPQALQTIVAKYASESKVQPGGLGQPNEDFEDQRLQKIFNETFNDEANLVRATFENEMEESDVTQIGVPVPARQAVRESGQDLWGASSQPPSAPPPSSARPQQRPKAPVMGAEDSMAYKAVLEREVETKLGGRDLDEMVDKILNRLVPPLVEKLVQERLDKLMKEQEDYQELKPNT